MLSDFSFCIKNTSKNQSRWCAIHLQHLDRNDFHPLQPPTVPTSLVGWDPPALTPTGALLPRRRLLWAGGLVLLEARVSLSASSEADIQPLGTWGGVRTSLPWSLHYSQMHTTGPMSGQEGDPYPSWRCTHCSQLNPSGTSFPCWEEAPFIYDRSTLSCCFLSRLSPASSEISGKTCSYSKEWDALQRCTNHLGTLALCCSEAICGDKKGKAKVQRATNRRLVYKKLQAPNCCSFLLGAAHYKNK